MLRNQFRKQTKNTAKNLHLNYRALLINLQFLRNAVLVDAYTEHAEIMTHIPDHHHHTLHQVQTHQVQMPVLSLIHIPIQT